MESLPTTSPTRAERRREERRREKLEAAHVGELLEELAIRKARRSFWHFRRWLAPKMLVGWWQREVCRELQQFYDALIAGRRPKLVISAPPQHGKSRIVVEFIAWLCGKHPEFRTIYVSYSDRLGVRANSTLQRTFAGKRFQAVFPGFGFTLSKARLSDGTPAPKVDQTIIEFAGTEGNFRNTTILGPITGEGLDLGVIDDPLKGRREANSQTVRDATWDWLTDDFLTRFSDGAGMLVIATRWHVDDPTGRLRAHYGDAVRIVNWPAIATEDEEHRREGEALFPEHKSLDFLLERQAVLRDFDAVYQGAPRVRGGNIIRGEWFKTYTVAPVLKYRHVYADTAQKTREANDYSVFQAWGLGTDGKLYLLDQARGKWPAPELKRRAKAFWQKQKALEPVRFGELRAFKVEDKSSGTGLIQELQSEAAIPVLGIPRSVDKYTRVGDVLGYIESGYVVLPEDAPWLSDFVAEAEAFTADDSHAHDDQVDPMVDAIKEMLADQSGLALWEKLG